ncbi:DUF4349 domain-containing protein [Halobacteriales archaeon QS_3_64_16]|nr:MAG: DUF4349 domain-containing protein [Halobacteriales archaeon QS_3_64_16]
MRSNGRRWWVPLVLALVVVLAGCGGSGGSDGGGGDASAGGDVGSEAMAETAGAGGGAGSAGGETDSAGSERTAEAIGSEEVLQTERRQALVRTGRVALTVENVSATERELTRAVRDADGFVSSSRVRRDDREEGTVVTSRLVVRVPSENFSTVFARIERAGEVRASNTSTRDVSEQLVDVQARLENLRAQRERLRGLYAQANDTEALLAIQERLSEVQSRIERLEARQQSLRRQVALSTIVVDLAEPLAGPKDRSRAWYDTGVLAAVLDSFGGVGTVLRAIVVGLAYVLPYLLVFGVPIAVLAYLLRYRRRGEKRDTA